MWGVWPSFFAQARFMLCFECPEHAVGVILDNVVLDGAAFLAALGPRFDVDHTHSFLPVPASDMGPCCLAPDCHKT